MLWHTENCAAAREVTDLGCLGYGPTQRSKPRHALKSSSCAVGSGLCSPGETLTKYNPLANWSSQQVWDYIRAYQVPYNLLHERGFVSIGCEPCTKAIGPGQHEREGRWWWEAATKKECGLHGDNLKAKRPLASGWLTTNIPKAWLLRAFLQHRFKWLCVALFRPAEIHFKDAALTPLIFAHPN